jgi:hypothetical protein
MHIRIRVHVQLYRRLLQLLILISVHPLFQPVADVSIDGANTVSALGWGVNIVANDLEVLHDNYSEDGE